MCHSLSLTLLYYWNMKLGAPCKHMEDVFHLPVFMCVFTWYSHPLTHAVGRTRVPHVLGWGRVVWARRGVWGGACVPANTYANMLDHLKGDGAVLLTSTAVFENGAVQSCSLLLGSRHQLTWKRGSSSPGDCWTLILSDPPGQQYWCRSFVCWGGDQIWIDWHI